MAKDSDPILASQTPDDLSSIVTDLLGSIQYKFLGFLFLLFILVSSDVFVSRVLTTFDGAVDMKCPTNWGVFLQALVLVIGMTFIDAMIKQKII